MVNYLKKIHFTVARQIEYLFKQLWGKVILGGMHSIDQILNFDDRREFQSRNRTYACPNSYSGYSKY